MRSRQLVEKFIPPDLEDLALNFVEEVVGRYQFPTTWSRYTVAEQLALAEGWLRGKEDRLTQPKELVNKVRQIAAEGYRWKR